MRWIKLGWNKLLEEMYYDEVSYNETRTVTRKENKIKSLFYSIRDLRLRETAGAKLHRRRRWRNSWNPWRNVRSSITESVLQDFSILFFFPYREISFRIAAEFNRGVKATRPAILELDNIFLATVHLRAARRHDKTTASASRFVSAHFACVVVQCVLVKFTRTSPMILIYLLRREANEARNKWKDLCSVKVEIRGRSKVFSNSLFIR